MKMYVSVQTDVGKKQQQNISMYLNYKNKSSHLFVIAKLHIFRLN